MAWLEKNKRNWRLTCLLLLFIAVIGPWFLERINIPAPYDCPGIRLDDNFCGTPTSILWILIFILFNLKDFISSLFNGTGITAALLFISGLLIIILPPLSTLLLIFFEDHPRRKKVQIALFSFGAAASLFFVFAGQLIPDFSNPIWLLWGFWLYLIAAAGMLILESLLLLKTRPTTYG